MRTLLSWVGLPIVAVAILMCSASQSKADDTFTCPVTKNDPSFMPPAPFAPDGGWFGTEKLWTILGSRWVAGNSDLGYEVRKVVWFSKAYDAKSDGRPALAVAGRRLDGPSGPVSVDVAGGYIERPGQLTKSFMPSNLYFPTLGCWEITAHYKGAELAFVVNLISDDYRQRKPLN